MLVSLVLLISTQARGAIFSLVPILLLTYLIFIKFEIKIFLFSFFILISVVIFKNYSFLLANIFLILLKKFL